MTRKPGFLFDLDGTLLDTDHLHLEAFRALLGDDQRTISEAYYNEHIMGSSNIAIMRGLFPDIPEETYPALGEQKEELFRAMLDTALEPKPGLMTLLDWAETHDIACCVVTNAPRANAERMLAGLGLAKRLPELVIGEELEHGKPHPLPYAQGLRRIGCQAEHALAFEDSAPGVKSASSAGIFTFGMLGALDEAALKRAGASETISDFTAPRLWEIIGARIAG